MPCPKTTEEKLNIYNIIQINLGKRKSASMELERLLSEGKTDIALIQEPKITKYGIAISGGIKLFKNAKPRACIWMSSSFYKTSKCMLRQDLSDRDTTTISITINTSANSTKEILISSIYCPATNDTGRNIPDPITDTIRKIVEYGKTKNAGIIIGGDFNAHHALWGNPTDNRRGQNVIDYITVEQINILNEGIKPTYSNSWASRNTNRTVIDLTLCNNIAREIVNKWHVTDIIQLSDHKAINFTLKIQEYLPVKSRNRKKTNYEGYIKMLEDSKRPVDKIHSREMLEIEADRNKENIIKAFENNCVEVLPRKRFKKAWMTKDIDRLRTKMVRAFNSMKKNYNISDINYYKACRNKFTLECGKAKEKAWKEMTTELDNIKDVARLQRFFENGPRKTMGNLSRSDGTTTVDNEETTQLLMEKHFPGCREITGDEEERRNEQDLRDEEVEEIDKITTLDEIVGILQSFGPYKTAGADGIFPALLSKGSMQVAPMLSEMFRASLRLSYIPLTWRETNVIFIPKHGKGDYSDPKAYRPISLMSFNLKCLEKIIDRRIRQVNLKRSPLHRAQHAYQQGKGTDSALHQLFTNIEKSLEYKGISLVVFIDIQGAFDNTETEVILEAAGLHGVELWIINWIETMLKNRVVIAGDKKKRYRTVKGCPQGGCLSPLLWCLVMDSLIRELSEEGFRITAYADDLTITVSGKDNKVICAKMNEAMGIMERWCTKHRLSVNPDKTEMMRFTKRHNSEAIKITPEIKLMGKTLKLVESVKYLGITMDPKLNMGKHIKTISDSAIRSLFASRAIVGRKWGLGPSKSMWIYKSIILTRITYGAIVWWNSAQKKTKAATLNRVQRIALLMVTGAMRSTPTDTLNAIFNLDSLKLKLMETALMTHHRLKKTGNWIEGAEKEGQHGHIRVVADKIINQGQLDQICKVPNNAKRYSTAIRDRTSWDVASRNEGVIKWFSDGSKREGRTASGIYSSRSLTGKNARLEDYNTVMQAETYAIEMCANEGIISNIRNRKIIIYSDSQAAILALNNTHFYAKTVQNCATKLNELAINNEVVICWVPGHKGIRGNEEADKQANLGIEKEETEIRLPIPESQVMKQIKEETAKKAAKSWREQDPNKLKHSQMMIERPEDKRAKVMLKLGRKKLRIAIGILSGHCCLAKHMKRLGKMTHNRCRFCNVATENMEHILMKCPAISTSRLITTGKMFMEKNEVSRCDIHNLINFIYRIELHKTFFRN